VKRNAWTDARLDDKMEGIDSTFEMMRDELHGLRTDMREEMRELRSDFSALQTTLVQIGFGLVGVLFRDGGADSRAGLTLAPRTRPGYPWISQPSVARAASSTVSAKAGCGWMEWASSW